MRFWVVYREDDLGSRDGVNPDQSRNSVELPDPSDHPQESHHQILILTHLLRQVKPLHHARGCHAPRL